MRIYYDVYSMYDKSTQQHPTSKASLTSTVAVTLTTTLAQRVVTLVAWA
jgi:hypothetical protein